MSGALPLTSRNYTESEHMFVGASPQQRSINSMNQKAGYTPLVGAGIADLSSEELARFSDYKTITESGSALTPEQAQDYEALQKKAKCWKGLGIRGPDFSLIQQQLAPGAGGWCAFLSTFVCTMIVAILTGWTVASIAREGQADINYLAGPTIWGIASLLACLVGTFCMCPPEINIFTHLARLFFDAERFNKNLGMHFGHILGNVGWFVGYVIVWVMFEDFPGAYEAATAYVHAPYNIGRAFLTEALLTFVLCLGALAITIIVPYWMIERQKIKEEEGLSLKTTRLVCCMVDALLLTGCTFAGWNVTGSALNLFRWLAAAVMNGGFSYEVAASWWIYPVAGLVGCVVASLLFWIFLQLSGQQYRSKMQ